jgi:hypothetical protein
MAGFDPETIAKMITESPDGTVGGPGVAETVTGAVIPFEKHIDMGHYFVVFVKPRDPGYMIRRYTSRPSRHNNVGRWSNERGPMVNWEWPSSRCRVPAGQRGAFGQCLISYQYDVLPLTKGRLVKFSLRR